ncbi:hypothetical protein VTO73DRAFT_11755 [Trametes versicolor]
MFPTFLSAPLTKLRSYVSKPATPAPAPAPAPAPGGALRRARPLSTASSITLGPPLPTPPPPAATQPSELWALGHQADLIANFWGGGPQGARPAPPPKRPRGSRETSVESFELGMAKEWREPGTLARRMFVWGFLLPFLWMVGAVFVFKPTPYEPDLERASVASAEDMQRHKTAYRAAEEKWSRRCLIATMSFWGAVVVIVTTVVLAEKNM